MSQWTHVCATFRIDALDRVLSNDTIESVIGKPIGFCEFVEEGVKYLPKGSEGSLKYELIENPDKGTVAAYVLVVYGDLRDYDNIDEIELWFRKGACSFSLLRQAVCTVEVEDRETFVIATVPRNYGVEFRRIIISRKEE